MPTQLFVTEQVPESVPFEGLTMRRLPEKWVARSDKNDTRQSEIATIENL